MNSRWLTMLLVAVIIGAALGLGYQQASGKTALLAGAHPEYSLDSPTPEPNPVDAQIAPIDEPVSADAIVTSSITYQGALKENGAAVTGSRQMTFRLYSATDCSAGLLATQGPQSVAVKDGLFNVVLNFNPYHFQGEARALSVDIAGTKVACSNIYPTPYALSLRPGAVVDGAIGSGDVLYVKNTTTANYGNALRGYSTGYGGAGIVGISDNGNGYGVWAANSNGGVALYANGDIQSSEDTILVLSPHGLVERDGSTMLSMQPLENGAMQILATSSGPRYVSLPVQVPGVLFGSKFSLKKVEVCFKVSGSGGAKVEAISAIHYTPPEGYGIYTMDTTVHTNTTAQCYATTDATPEWITHSTWIQLNLNSSATGGMNFATWTIYEIKLTITQAP